RSRLPQGFGGPAEAPSARRQAHGSLAPLVRVVIRVSAVTAVDCAVVYFCGVPGLVAFSDTVRYGFSFRKLFSPIPFTFIRSSTFLNCPFFCRYSTIRCATFGPMPGNDSNCASVAVLMLIGDVGAAVDFAADDRDEPPAAFCCCAAAGIAAIARTARSMTIPRIRVPPEETGSWKAPRSQPPPPHPRPPP